MRCSDTKSTGRHMGISWFLHTKGCDKAGETAFSVNSASAIVPCQPGSAWLSISWGCRSVPVFCYCSYDPSTSNISKTSCSNAWPRTNLICTALTVSKGLTGQIFNIPVSLIMRWSALRYCINSVSTSYMDSSHIGASLSHTGTNSTQISRNLGYNDSTQTYPCSYLCFES